MPAPVVPPVWCEVLTALWHLPGTINKYTRSVWPETLEAVGRRRRRPRREPAVVLGFVCTLETGQWFTRKL